MRRFSLASLLAIALLAPGGALVPGCPPITYAANSADVTSWFEAHGGASALGFDTETKPMFRKGRAPNPPACLQLATADSCLVIHLTRLRAEGAWPPPLVAALADERVLKVGVGIDDDAVECWLHWGLDVRGRLDLGGVGSVGGETRGLKSLALDVLGVELPKSKSVTMSNWELELSGKMLAYAAADAWVGRAVLDALAARQPAVFGTAAGRARLLAGERELSELYARRRVRQTVRRSIVSLEQLFEERGLPGDHSLPADPAARRARSRMVQKHMGRMRSAAAKAFACDPLPRFAVGADDVEVEVEEEDEVDEDGGVGEDGGP